MNAAFEIPEQIDAPDRKPFRRYLLAFAGPLLLGLAGVAIFNLLIDPYDIYPRVHLDALDDYRIHRNSRTAKAELLYRRDAGAILAGTSRVAVGYDPQQPDLRAWLEAHAPESAAVNLGLAAADLTEVIASLRLALEQGEPRLVVVALDLVIFNARRSPAQDFEQSLFNPDRALLPYHLDNLISSRATTHSLTTLRSRFRGDQVVWNELGFRSRPRREFDRRRAFEIEIGNYVAGAGTYGQFTYLEDGTRRLRDVLEACRERGAVVIVVINPIHLAQLIAIDEMGLWPHLERLKREAASLSTNAEGEQGRILAFDALIPNEYTTEPLPESGAMQWWWESSHFRAPLGSLILSQVIAAAEGRSAAERPAARLSPRTIDAHLCRVRREFDRALADDPDLTSWVRSIVAETRPSVGG